MKIRKLNYLLLSTVVLISIIGCEPGLMPYEEFSSIKDLELPRTLHLKSDSKELFYIGTHHTNDKADTLFRYIRKSLEEMKPDYILHEGGSNWPIYGDIDSTILASGEPGFVIQLAQEMKVDYESIEPPINEEYAHLLEEYDLDWVVLMYFCRQIDQQKRIAEVYPTSDLKYIQNMNYFIRMMQEKGIPLKGDQLQYSYWKKKYEDLLGKKLEWRKLDPSIYTPDYTLTKLNDVNRTSDTFRNTFMVEKIFNQLEKRDKVFVLVGGGHLVIQEELISYKFNKKYY